MSAVSKTLTALLLGCIFVVAGDAKAAPVQQGSQDTQLTFDERKDLLKQEIAAAAAEDVPEIMLRALQQLGNTKTGGFRIREIASERLDGTVPVLLAIAADSKHELQGAAEWGLSELAHEAEPWLIASLSVEDASTRHLAVELMMRKTFGSETTQAELHKLLRDADANIRHQAAIGLLASEPQSAAAKDAAALLMEEYDQLADKPLALRYFARFGKELKSAPQLTRIFLADSSAEIRASAGHQLFHSGLVPSAEFVPALIDGLRVSGASYQRDAILNLAVVGADAHDALDELKAIADSEGEEQAHLRPAAHIAICHIDAHEISTRLPKTYAWLAAEENLGTNHREELLNQIGRMGRNASTAVTALEEMFDDPREPAHVDIALTVMRIDRAGPMIGLAMMHKVIRGDTPNPNRYGYHWPTVQAAAELAPDLADAMEKETDRTRLWQLCWIWRQVLPEEAAKSIVPRVKEIIANKRDKSLRQQLNSAMLRIAAGS